MSGIITPTLAYDFVYSPSGWNRVWNDAKAASPTTPCWITFIGDSITWGSGVTDQLVGNFMSRLKTALSANYPTFGDFFPTHCAHLTGPNSSAWGGTAPWVHNVAPTSWAAGNGMGTAPFYSGAQAGYQMTLVTPYACTQIEIVYLSVVGGTWVYNIDGAGDVTVTNNTTGSQHRKVTISGLANTTHTVQIGKQSATNVCIIAGAGCIADPTKGIGYARMAYSGAYAESLRASTGGAVPSDRCLLWQGKQADGTAVGFGFPTQPSLAVIALGVNDCQGNYGPIGYDSVLRRLVQAFRRGVDNCSLLFLAPCFPDYVSSDAVSGFSNPRSWARYRAAMRSVAETYNGAYVDIHAKWGEYPVAKGFMTTSNSHPNTAGHTDIYNTLAPLIL